MLILHMLGHSGEGWGLDEIIDTSKPGDPEESLSEIILGQHFSRGLGFDVVISS